MYAGTKKRSRPLVSEHIANRAPKMYVCVSMTHVLPLYCVKKFPSLSSGM